MKNLKLIAISSLIATVIVLAISQHQTFQELEKVKVHNIMVSQQMGETQYMLEMFWRMAPEEMERIAREVVREELGRPVLKTTLVEGSDI